MSRIGLKPVSVPKGVTVAVKDNILTVKGAKGELTQAYEPEVSFELKGDSAIVSRRDDTQRAKSMHGLYRKLLENMVEGVSTGFSKSLVINGVGYRAESRGKSLFLNLGFSTQIEYVLPEGVSVTSEGNKVTVSGISKELVGLVASEIRGLRPPEPYKGKGIKYETEHVRRKVGKSGVK
jgi:large subunit ribosomal protein L6